MDNVVWIGVTHRRYFNNAPSPQLSPAELRAAEQSPAKATSPTVPTREHLDAFFARVDPVRGRLIFAIDATASRQPTWDTAAKLTSQLFDAAAATGGIDIQLVYYRGAGECVASRWLSDAKSLASIMSGVMCRAGETQIKKVLSHACKENQRQKVDALVLISDACEELLTELYGQARELGSVPVFLFQEGDDKRVAEIYAAIAAISGGAVAKFDTGAAQRLADLLKAVAAFAAGGIKALAAQKTEAATLLIGQLKN
jgi:hypothetical protein